MNPRIFSLRPILFLTIAAVGFFAGRLTPPFPRDSSRSMEQIRAKMPPALTSGGEKLLPGLTNDISQTENSSANFSVRASRQTQSLAADDDRQKLLDQWAEHDPLGAID